MVYALGISKAFSIPPKTEKSVTDVTARRNHMASQNSSNASWRVTRKFSQEMKPAPSKTAGVVTSQMTGDPF
jgi:phosphohistidine swiveling domain-containing protein